MKKSKVGIYFALFSVVLTIFLTAGKVIEKVVVFRRIFINAVIFFLIGYGLELFYKKVFINSVLEEEKPGNGVNGVNIENNKEEIKGKSFDAIVGNEDNLNEILGKNNIETEVNETVDNDNVTDNDSRFDSDTVNNNDTLSDGKVDFVESRPTHSTNGKPKVDGKYIVIDDTRIPNNPELIAKAIKSKLSDEE